MNNVIRLIARKKAEAVPSELESRVAAAVKNVLASSLQLSDNVKELSRQFDLVQNAIGTIEDPETRTRHRDLINLSRETMSNAMLGLSRQIGTLVGCQGA